VKLAGAILASRGAVAKAESRTQLLAPPFASLAATVLLLCAGIACGETSDRPSEQKGGTGGGGVSASAATADTSCPAQMPTHDAPCLGALSCFYGVFAGCFPSTVVATCNGNRWDVPEAKPYSGPCPGDLSGEQPMCPAQQPIPATSCPLVSTLDGPPFMIRCEYTDPACLGPRVATCNGLWQLTPCVPANTGGAGAGGGGGDTGGAPSDGAAGAAGSADQR